MVRSIYEEQFTAISFNFEIKRGERTGGLMRQFYKPIWLSHFIQMVLT